LKLNNFLRPGANVAVNPVVLIVGAVVLTAGAFYAGDAASTRISLPGLNSVAQVDYSSLSPLYDVLKSNFDGTLSSQQAVDGAREGLVASTGDPYTVYLTAKQAKALNDDLTGQLSGIGAEIGKKNNSLTVIAPIDDTPAAKAGIRTGDMIADIDGQDTTNMSVDEAVTKIRGKAGTQVKLKIYRSGASEPLNLTITRANITVPSVKWSMKSGNIGYINITQFGPDTAGLVDKAAGELKSQGATKIILDLRNDPGGYLDAAVKVSSQFLPSGKTVVSERKGPGGKTVVDTLNANNGGQLIGVPTVVLINSGSASASEIVSAALHDNHAAKLVGVTSFGKGSVQEIKDLAGGAQLKVTVAHWYTPGGININKAGIKPDVNVDLTTDDFNAGRDPQLDKAISLLQ
jgi:carboxyl-terminal processing protease